MQPRHAAHSRAILVPSTSALLQDWCKGPGQAPAGRWSHPRAQQAAQHVTQASSSKHEARPALHLNHIATALPAPSRHDLGTCRERACTPPSALPQALRSLKPWRAWRAKGSGQHTTCLRRRAGGTAVGVWRRPSPSSQPCRHACASGWAAEAARCACKLAPHHAHHAVGVGARVRGLPLARRARLAAACATTVAHSSAWVALGRACFNPQHGTCSHAAGQVWQLLSVWLRPCGARARPSCASRLGGRLPQHELGGPQLVCTFGAVHWQVPCSVQEQSSQRLHCRSACLGWAGVSFAAAGDGLAPELHGRQPQQFPWAACMAARQPVEQVAGQLGLGRRAGAG